MAMLLVRVSRSSEFDAVAVTLIDRRISFNLLRSEALHIGFGFSELDHIRSQASGIAPRCFFVVPAFPRGSQPCKETSHGMFKPESWSYVLEASNNQLRSVDGLDKMHAPPLILSLRSAGLRFHIDAFFGLVTLGFGFGAATPYPAIKAQSPKPKP